MIDTILLEEPSEKTIRKINIPDNTGFNAQSFYYAFRLEDHVLVFESKNAFNATLRPSNAEKILKTVFDDSAILQMPFEGERPEFVEVDLIVQQDALDRIFSIPVLNSLVFTISPANQDDKTAGAEAIISRLRNVHARRQVIEYNALDRKTGLSQDDEMRREGKAALIQVSARGEGTENGEPVSRNSKQYAKKEAAYINAGASAIDTVIRMAKSLFKERQSLKPIEIYWSTYGGWRALFGSLYLWMAVVLALAMAPAWLDLDKDGMRTWPALPLSVLPNILGFSMGGMAIVIAFSGSTLFRLLTEDGKENS